MERKKRGTFQRKLSTKFCSSSTFNSLIRFLSPLSQNNKNNKKERLTVLLSSPAFMQM
jgi:hypothetical protein